MQADRAYRQHGAVDSNSGLPSRGVTLSAQIQAGSIALAATLVMISCASDSSVDLRSAGMPSEIAGSVVARIDGRVDAPFGGISSLAFADSGVIVLDNRAQEVIWIGRAGETISFLGGRGDGPGELNAACCVRLSDRLMVYSPGRARLDIFEISGNAMIFDSRVTLDLPGYYLSARQPVVLEDGHLLVTGEAMGGASNERTRVLLELAANGSLVGQHPRLENPLDSLDRIVSIGSTGRSASIVLPLGRGFLEAFASDGSVAHAFTSSGAGYDIVFRELNGAVRHSVSAVVPRLPITDEQDQQISTLVAQVERAAGAGTRVEVHRPEWQRVLRRIWFDTDDNLWAERFLPSDSTLTRADVYSKNGEFLHVASWPNGVDLSLGVSSTREAWGVTEDRLGVQSLVRIVFSAADSPRADRD